MRTIIPRSLFGLFHSIFAILQQLSLIFQLLLSFLTFNYPGTFPRWLLPFFTCAPPTQGFDVIFMDQQAVGVPWIKILSMTRVVFYCHFPDKDVSNSIAKQKAIARGHSGPSAFRFLYRVPLNLLEEGTINYSDKILVNSEFTAQHFGKSFARLGRLPRVLYPGIDHASYEPEKVKVTLEKLKAEVGELSASQKAILDVVTSNERPLVLSINRFEAKKNVSLALDAFAGAQKSLATSDSKQTTSSSGQHRLIIAGGYDRRVQDNISTLDELQKQATQLGLTHTTLFFQSSSGSSPLPSASDLSRATVIFLPSLPGPLLNTLLVNQSIRALLYTPTDEHFGIVPLEAMACGIPVLATNTGGPVESVVDAQWSEGNVFQNEGQGTGLLRHPNKEVWAGALVSLLTLSDAQRGQFQRAAKDRVKSTFSLQVMTKGLEKALLETVAFGPVRSDEGLLQWGSTVGVFCLMAVAYYYLAFGKYAQERDRKRAYEDALKVKERGW